MKKCQDYMHFNVRILTNFFGCSTFQFNEKQINELKIIYKLPMIIKLGLGDNFPLKLLHSQKSNLGIGLIKPNTVIDTLVIRLHIEINDCKEMLIKYWRRMNKTVLMIVC